MSGGGTQPTSDYFSEVVSSLKEWYAGSDLKTAFDFLLDELQHVLTWLPLVAALFAVVYPWMYTLFDNVLCQPYGTLALMQLRCECPVSREGPRCETCVPEKTSAGICSGKHVICNDKWSGPNCTTCHAENKNHMCTGDCNNTLHWYNDDRTGRCTYCMDTTSCSGHGTCLPSGICNCSAGYAGAGTLNLAGVADCSLPCPSNHNGICNGHGTCIGGGNCQCSGVWCGIDCTTVTSDDNTCNMNDCDPSKPCGGNGYPVQMYDEKTNMGSKACKCECKLDRNGDQRYLGPYCQYKCPIGKGGTVCGKKGASFQPANSEKCMCKCGSKLAAQAGPCESDCFFGGTEDVNGDCKCMGNAESPCDRCKPGYWMPELGCTEHCVDGVTCQSGVCGPAPFDRLVVQCNGCDGYYDPTISSFVQRTDVDKPIYGSANHTISFKQNVLLPDETREIVLTPKPFTSSAVDQPKAVLETESGSYSLTLGSNMTAEIKTTPAEYSQLTFAPNKLYQLLVPMQYPITSSIYINPILGVPVSNGTIVTNFALLNSTASTICTNFPACVGYSTSNGGELYSHFCQSKNAAEGCTSQLIGNNAQAVVREVRLHATTFYNVKIVDTLQRGCYECLKDYYPHPNITVVGNDACKTQCTPALCNNLGTCSDTGQCICKYPNMGPHCTNCTAGYYPAPGNTNGPTVCSVRCDPNAAPNPAIAMNACSGHGFCNPANGECLCQDSQRTTETNGWSGVPKGSACNIACAISNTTNATSVCSNNGKCIDSVCACYPGYFGAHCNITCSRDDQQFWVLDSTPPRACPNSARGCDTGLACGDKEVCTRLTCNGGGCERSYQYEHTYEGNFASVYYTYCNVTDALGTQPLRECTALTQSQYELLENSSAYGAKRAIEQTMGIFCDVSNIASDPSWKQTHGICARTQCDCSSRRQGMNKGGTAAVEMSTNAKGQPTLTSLSPSMPTAGTGCQYTGCVESEFGSEGSAYQSMCGRRPPPALAEGNPFNTLYGSDSIELGQNALDGYLDTQAKFCSHGECAPLDRSPGATVYGTQENPAVETAEAIHGSCKCKNAPQVSSLCTGSNINVRTWPSQCCSGYYDSNSKDRTLTSLFYGINCAEQCSCANSDYTRGTCMAGSSQTHPVMGVACNCREGYRGTGTPAPQTPGNYSNMLFCGMSCRYQCMGVVNLTSGVLAGYALPGACPADKAKDSTPPLQEGCYENVLPCWGHGQCAGQGQTCRIRRTVDSQAPCACWGADVDIADADNNGVLLNQILLPPRVTLYGGDDCRRECPGVQNSAHGKLSALAYFTEHRAELETSPPTAQQRNVLEGFVQAYSTNVCSGHGYCTGASVVVNSTLQCTCTGDWGGLTCNEKCSLPAKYWMNSANHTMPLQDLNSTDAVELALNDEFGLHLCGPHACCGCDGSYEKKCDQDVLHFRDGSFDAIYRLPQNGGRLDILTFLSNLPGVNAANLQAFIGQWSLAFVGPFSTCAKDRFSSRGLDRSTGIHDELLGVPQYVAWHVTRTCDAVYKSNKWESGVPWCCNAASSTNALPLGQYHPWQDEAYAPFGHGGCPEGACPNFASGRMCTTCVNDQYTYYNTDDGNNQCTTPPQLYGYCTICKMSGNDHRISPFSQPNETYWPNTCEYCIGSQLGKSGLGLQPVENTNHQICNAFAAKGSRQNGCIGHVNTFSGRAVGIAGTTNIAFNNPSQYSLLLGGSSAATVRSRLQLGLCACDENWNGPTCALPKTSSACNNKGNVTQFSVQSPYREDNELYHYCTCTKGNTGIYCELTANAAQDGANLGPFATYIRIGDNPARIQECNGHGSLNDGACTCDDAQLDPHTACREYKAKGTNGVRTRQQINVLKKIPPSLAWNAEIETMHTLLDAELQLPADL